MTENILGVELQLSDFTNVIDMNFDFGLLELEYNGKKFVTDSFDTDYNSFNSSVYITFKVNDDCLTNSKQDLIIDDIINLNELNVDFYIGCEYTVDVEVKTLFLRTNGCTITKEFI